MVWMGLLGLVLVTGIHLGAVEGAWVAPDQYTDDENKWVNEQSAYDSSTATYAEDRCNRAGFGPWLGMYYTGGILTDRVQVVADFGYNIVDWIEIEALDDSNYWRVVVRGATNNDALSIFQIASNPILVKAFRFRFHYKVSGYYFWLYDFKAYRFSGGLTDPVVRTDPPFGVTESSAVLRATLLADGGAPNRIRFLYNLASWKTPTYFMYTDWTDYVAQPGDQTGMALAALRGLKPGETITYYAVAMSAASSSSGTWVGVGDQVTFVTAPIADQATGWFPSAFAEGTKENGMVWDAALRAVDGDQTTAARCYHPLWASITSPALVFDLPAIPVDRVRLMAGRNPYIDKVTLSMKSAATGVWSSVYTGIFADRTWLEVPVSRDTYAQARFVFTTTVTGVGTAWELFECQCYKPEPQPLTAPVLSPSVIFSGQPTVVTAVARPGAIVRYTTDGAAPDSTSPQLPAAGVTLSHSCTLRAAAFQAGWLPSPESSVDCQIMTVEAALHAPAKTAATLTIAGITDADAPSWQYAWQVTGVGLAAPAVAGIAAQGASVTFDQVGSYRAQVRVQASNGRAATVERVIVVPAVETFIGITALAPVGP
jgi:hypothetical protein